MKHTTQKFYELGNATVPKLYADNKAISFRIHRVNKKYSKLQQEDMYFDDESFGVLWFNASDHRLNRGKRGK